VPRVVQRLAETGACITHADRVRERQTCGERKWKGLKAVTGGEI